MAVVCIAVVLIGAGTWGVLSGQGGLVLFTQEHSVDEPQPPDATDSTATEPSPPTPVTVPETSLAGDEWAVMEVGTTPRRGSRVVTDQAELDAAWEAFDMDGAAPVLPSGQGALVVAVAGECDDASQVHGIEWIPALFGERAYAAVHVDADCAFTERFRRATPPRTLYVVGVPVERTRRTDGIAAMTTPVLDFAWQVLAVVPDPNPNFGHYAIYDQDGVAGVWQQHGLDGPAPTLPDGWQSLIVQVRGTCSDEAQIWGVEPRGAVRIGGENSGNPTVFPAVLVDPACAQVSVEDHTVPQPGTLAAVAMPEEVVATMDGYSVFIDCRGTDSVGACEGADEGLVPERGWYSYADVDDPSLDPDAPEPDATDTDEGLPTPDVQDPPFRLGVVGDCDEAPDIRTVEWLPVPDDGPDVVELAIYDDCAFVERFATLVDPSRSLYAIADSSVRDLPADVLVRAAAFATVTEPVTPLDWDVLAAVPDAGYPPLLGMTATNPDSLELAWEMWGPVGQPAPAPLPALPDGRDVLLVPVPGTCTDASQIRGVDAVGSPTDPADPLFAAVYVDPACAEVTAYAELVLADEGDDQPVTLYAIAVPAGTVDSAPFGPGAFIDCRETDSVGACAPTDAELIHTPKAGRRVPGTTSRGNASRPVGPHAAHRARSF